MINSAITIIDVALARGAAEVDGAISGGEFDRVGLAILGGCERCGAQLAAYNAYPSTSGYWRCVECLEHGEGFESVDDFERFGH